MTRLPPSLDSLPTAEISGSTDARTRVNVADFCSRCIHLPSFRQTIASSGVMSAVWKKALVEHDVAVVNTFLQISEACPRQRRQRRRTVPATAAGDEFDVDTPVCDGSESGYQISEGFARQQSEKEVIEEPWLPSKAASTSTPRLLHSATPDLWEWDAMLYDLQMPDGITRQKSEKEAIEHCSEPSELMARSIRKLQSLRTLNRFDVPDLWELETLCQSLDESPEEPWLPSKAASTSTPRLLHSATPDLWEWDAMLMPATPAAPLTSAVQCDCKNQNLLQGSPNPTSTKAFSSIEPGTLETMHLQEDRVLVRWCVDAAKFASNSARLLSPDFHLHFPGQPEPLTFRMLVGGKNAGFKKARARCSIELKCSCQVPAGVGSVTAWVSIDGARKQVGAKPIEHNFADKTCCQLRNGEEVNWDFKRSIGDAKSCEIAVEIQL